MAMPDDSEEIGKLEPLPAAVEQACREYESAWKSGQPPNREEFLTRAPASQADLLLRRLLEVDSIYRRPSTDVLPVATATHDSAKAAGSGGSQGSSPDRPAARHTEVVAPSAPSSLTEAVPSSAIGTDHGRAAQGPSPQGGGPLPDLEDFQILDRLGKGAFGAVYLAYQKSMGWQVALKVSRGSSQEPETLAQLKHPNIVQVHGQQWMAREGMRLVWMEFVPGGTLVDVIERLDAVAPQDKSGAFFVELMQEAGARSGRETLSAADAQWLSHLPWSELVCRLGIMLAEGLAHAHANGILHRDIKPANVLLTAAGVPKLADFNVAYSEVSAGANPEQAFGGTLMYMSPEQLAACRPDDDTAAGDLDVRSDLYALALVLWELLTGKRPFPDVPGGSWREALEALHAARSAGLAEEIRQAARQTCMGGLVDVLARCLAVNPDERIHSADALAAELRLCLNPRAHALLRRPEEYERLFVARHPLAMVIAAALAPNVVISALNVSYDWWAIVVPRLPESAQLTFLGSVITLLKLAIYLAGLAVAVPIALPVIWAVQYPDFRAVAPQVAARSLRLGDLVFWTSMACWASSGILFPGWLHWQATPLVWQDYAHFMASHVLSGMVAGNLAYFLVQYVAVRHYYPKLAVDGMAPEEIADLLVVRERIGRFAWVAVAVPLASVGVLALSDYQFRPAFGGLAVLGFLVFLCTSWMTRVLQADLAAFHEVALPPAARATLAGGVGLSKQVGPRGDATRSINHPASGSKSGPRLAGSKPGGSKPAGSKAPGSKPAGSKPSHPKPGSKPPPLGP